MEDTYPSMEGSIITVLYSDRKNKKRLGITHWIELSFCSCPPFIGIVLCWCVNEFPKSLFLFEKVRILQRPF